jgi:hypothetical protein
MAANPRRDRPGAPASAATPPHAHEGNSSRQAWNAALRAAYRAQHAPAASATECERVRSFYRHLVEAIQYADASQHPMALLILHLPLGPTQPWQQRQLEHRLRAGVRQTDIPGCLSDTTFAVALPKTGKGVALVVARLERQLSEIAKGRVAVGVAHWPADGQTALELLRTAIRRSLRTLPGRQMDPELARLVGPLSPSE